jgi:hypothetical protein
MTIKKHTFTLDREQDVQAMREEGELLDLNISQVLRRILADRYRTVPYRSPEPTKQKESPGLGADAQVRSGGNAGVSMCPEYAASPAPRYKV